MNRILLSLICCTPLLINVSNVQSVDLIGPDGETLDVPVVEAPIVTTVVEPVIAKAKTYGPITTYETLWSVSTKLRPNNRVSVFQTLVAIYKTNPSAFLNGDINKIISKSVIQIPSDEFIAQQTNAEATRLLNQQVKPIIKTPPVPAVVESKPIVIETKPVDETQSVAAEIIEEDVQPELIEEVQAEAKEEVAAEAKEEVEEEENNAQEKELADLNEQLIVLTEANQRLKIKLQPLSDQITLLSDQIDEDAKIQKELQDIIDEYRAQIDAFVEPPFSGEGFLNSILRAITSSATVLISTILFPILLLIAAFLFILRLKSKRELEENEKELAESTDISNEDTDEFDTLLTDEIVDLDNQDVKEQAPEELQQEENANQTEINETLNNSEIEALINEDLSVEAVVEQEDLVDLETLNNQSEEVIELSEIDLDAEAEQNDLELAAEWESQLANANADEDLEIEEPTKKVTSVDPLEDMEEAFSVLDGADKIDASKEDELVEIPDEEVLDEDELEIIDTNSAEENELIEVPEAVELESIDSASETDELVDIPDEEVADEDELESIDSASETDELVDIPNEKVVDEDELESIDSASETDELVDIPDEEVADDDELESIDSASETDKLVDIPDEEVTDEDELESIDSASETDELVDIPDEEVADEDELENIDTASETDELEITLDSENKSFEDLVQQATEIDDAEDKESLAEQLSDGAFNEDVELPSIDDHDQETYIDIDTLLSNNDSVDVAEEEFDLEFGLDEFPDVIDPIADFDTDADGVAAQLDLARAYLEIDEKESAKDILTKLLDSAENEKLKEVQKLLDRIS